MIRDEVVHMHFHLDYYPQVGGKNTQSFKLAFCDGDTTEENNPDKLMEVESNAQNVEKQPQMTNPNSKIPERGNLCDPLEKMGLNNSNRFLSSEAT